MSVVSILGAQWGDEGKGKIVDILCQDIDCVARFQGGANAGHTILISGEETILHQLPSGVMRKNIKCVLGNGMVIDPVALLDEIKMIEGKGLKIRNRLFISSLANVVTPLHKALDTSNETSLGEMAIGTTKKGIGPCYADKISRNGFLFKDLNNLDDIQKSLEKKTEDAINRKYIKETDKKILQDQYNEFYKACEILREYTTDTISMLNEMIKQNSKILVEGAQGSLLDIDFGTYPFVTSSNTTAGNISTGLGIGPTKIDKVLGVVKAYLTRVGAGPFPTELNDSEGHKLQKIGSEIGATTGRQRRCGWFDAVLGKYTSQINGFTSIIITKLDVLDDFNEIKICTKYKNGKFPDINLEDAEPEYIILPGWKSSICNIRDFDKLPENAKKYLATLENLLDVRISHISVGKGREQIIIR